MATTTESSSAWAKLPFEPSVPVKPFTLDIPKNDIEELQTLIKVSRFVPKSYENTVSDGRYGVTHEWMTRAVDVWKNSYDWSDRQARINRHPHFKATIKDDDGEVYDMHFMALFSKRQDALPLLMCHGWPGSFLEFLDLLDIVGSKYSAETSPFHIIVPSLPGYTLSSGPNKDFNYFDGARLLDKLMVTLGFSDGYAYQGGDVGGIMAPVIATTYSRVKAIHVNVMFQAPPNAEKLDIENDPDLSERDKFKITRQRKFFAEGHAYADLHGTRPATAGFVIGASPISLLAWIGEKMLQWTDERTPLPIETVLDNISLYWFTDTISRNMWPYRSHSDVNMWCMPAVNQPVGYSRFKYDLDQNPKKWAESMVDLQFFRDHEQGGHFAAYEKPEILWSDVDEFLRKVWPEKFV